MKATSDKAAKRTYRVAESFFGFVHAGVNAGRPAAFFRLVGEPSPYSVPCRRIMTAKDLEEAADRADPTGQAMVVLFGATEQLEDAPRMFGGRDVQIVTDGRTKPPRWVKSHVVAPTERLEVTELERASEVRVTLGNFKADEMKRIERIAQLNIIPLYVQPAVRNDGRADIAAAVKWVKAHPLWSLAVQWNELIEQ